MAVGLDEAGRGSLFGRLYVGAVIWPDSPPTPPFPIRDSKKVTKKRRGVLRKFIEENAMDWAVVYMEAGEIDRLNILQATMVGMHRALDTLRTRPTEILVDGDRFRPYRGIPHKCIPGGDDKVMAISCASILAKEYHDEWIREICAQNPTLEPYALLKNMGYGTKEHREAIIRLGPSPWHRLSFAPAKHLAQGSPNPSPPVQGSPNPSLNDQIDNEDEAE